jgi:hypothetical protein
MASHGSHTFRIAGIKRKKGVGCGNGLYAAQNIMPGSRFRGSGSIEK